MSSKNISQSRPRGRRKSSSCPKPPASPRPESPHHWLVDGVRLYRETAEDVPRIVEHPHLPPDHILNRTPLILSRSLADLEELPFPHLSKDDPLNITAVISLGPSQAHDFIRAACDAEEIVKERAEMAVQCWERPRQRKVGAWFGGDLEDLEYSALQEHLEDEEIASAVMKYKRRVWKILARQNEVKTLLKVQRW